MKQRAATLVLCLVLLLGLQAQKQQPKLPSDLKFVVLMLENRSFDHMLGFLKKDYNPKIDGLDGTETNPFNTTDKAMGEEQVNEQAIYVDPSPGHEIDDVTEQIFGSEESGSVALMNGFVQNARNQAVRETVMSCFNQTTAPVISTLAKEFALFDRWYSSVPGPTQVNRAYLHSATSAGMGFNDVARMVLGYDQKTIFQALSEQGKSWNVYMDPISCTLCFKWMRKPENLKRFGFMKQFEEAARDGNLADYTQIDPRFYDFLGKPANDQHPSHSVYEGEMLIKRVYEALRAGPQWNQTVFLITYDEHGGFYDHVPTPLYAPSPDGINSTKPPFDFSRLGVRVPTLVISPWVDKDTIVSEPERNHFEHSSVPATLRKYFDLGPDFLTKREEFAATFEGVLAGRAEPRTDCPEELPTPQYYYQPSYENDVLSELQDGLMDVAAKLADEAAPKITSELQAAEFVEQAVSKWFKINQPRDEPEF